MAVEVRGREGLLLLMAPRRAVSGPCPGHVIRVVHWTRSVGSGRPTDPSITNLSRGGWRLRWGGSGSVAETKEWMSFRSGVRVTCDMDGKNGSLLLNILCLTVFSFMCKTARCWMKLMSCISPSVRSMICFLRLAWGYVRRR